jgi:hypothetical protein
MWNGVNFMHSLLGKKLVIRELAARQNTDYSYSTDGMLEAQHLLTTEWKYLLAIDEFVTEKPTHLSKADDRYWVNQHHLWGSTHYEIRGGSSGYMLPPKQIRIHHGDSKVLKDDLDPNIGVMTFAFQLWHTGYARHPNALTNRLQNKIRNEIDAGIKENAGVLKFVETTFDYSRYKEVFPGAYLVPTNPNRLPSVLKENADRFNHWQPTRTPSNR